MRPLVVVKLGGSLAGEASLDGWLAAISRTSLPVVAVPGGGPFAEQVRTAQHSIGFSDRAAHAMAILAMEQFGLVIADRGGRFVPAASIAQMEQVRSAGQIAVWLPSRMALAEPAIPASWDVTSDSLAAWLARQMRAECLLLVKQSTAFSAGERVEELCRRGLVDPYLGALLTPAIALRLAGPQHLREAGGTFAAGRVPGVPVAAAVPTGPTAELLGRG